eukprot:13335846-Alexandrium_andersonii.AAC.1
MLTVSCSGRQWCCFKPQGADDELRVTSWRAPASWCTWPTLPRPFPSPECTVRPLRMERRVASWESP